MNHSSPMVTILLPVYNSEKYLKSSIDSILAQTYQNFEILIIDDNSQDNSLAIIKSYHDSRIKIIQNKQRIGFPQSLNLGIKLASGEYIARLDSDDLCFNNRIEIQVNYLDSHPECGLVAGKILLIDENGKENGVWEVDNQILSRESILKHLPFENCIAHSSVMGKREIFNRFLYDENLRYAEDYELWMRMAGNNVIIDKINKFIVYYRHHSENMSSSFEHHQDLHENFNDIRKKVLFRMSIYRNTIFYLRIVYAILIIEKGTYIELFKRYLKYRKKLR